MIRYGIEVRKGSTNFRLFDVQSNTLHGITIHYLDRDKIGHEA
jgi:hypothetical protein